ncbi:MAG: antitoxin component YwqK of YwqJK toxin-antitoxin module [Sphingobacteriales bacterium]|jgi:antitoxin component YwqK of YwqJK toxin-antitoxin module
MKKVGISLLFVLGVLTGATAQDVIFAENSVQEGFTGTHVVKADGAVEAEYTFKNGVPDGPVSFFNKEGNKTESGAFTKGKKNGTWEKFHNGDRVGIANYTNGKKDGEWKIYDTTGVLRYEMYFKKGQKVGTWKMYDEAGALTSEKEF